MFSALFGIERKRRKALVQTRSAVMRAYLETPLPAPRRACAEAQLVALDFETTGLDVDSDHILSIGLVGIERMAVQLRSARHRLIAVNTAIPESSAVIHGITDDQAARGDALDARLPWLLDALAGCAIVVHHAAIEREFLDAACQRLYGTPFVARFIDTEVLARRAMARRQQPFRGRDLRLFNLREAYHLPRYPAHHALSDALATAELFLALAAESNPAGKSLLGDFF